MIGYLLGRPLGLVLAVGDVRYGMWLATPYALVAVSAVILLWRLRELRS